MPSSLISRDTSSRSLNAQGKASKNSQSAPKFSLPVTSLDKNHPEPLYLQIKAWMVQEIEGDRWPLHYKLPAEEDLARSLKVSRGTLRQAIRGLIADKRLMQIHGKGTFVTSGQQIESSLADQLIAFSEDLMLQHIPFQTEVLEQHIIVPDTRVRALLNLGPDSLVFSLQRRRFVNNVPIILTRNYVRYELCAGIEREKFQELRLFRCLEDRYGLRLSWARRTSEARLATSLESSILGIAVGSPVMYMEQIVYLEDGRAVECSDIWLRGDRFRLSSIITRAGKHTSSNSVF